MSLTSFVSTGVAVLLATALAGTAHAETVTLNLKASDFVNVGISYPGYDGEIDVNLTWDTNDKADAIQSFLSIDIEIAGHQYTMAEVGIANQGSTQTAIGGVLRGANTVVGDGAGDDFLIVFDRVVPKIDAFAYSIAGKFNAIWWTPAHTSAAYRENTVPEPSSAALLLPALAWLALRRRRG